MNRIGTGTVGQGDWDACVGFWDLGTRGEGQGDVKYRDVGTFMLIAKVQGKAKSIECATTPRKINYRNDIIFFLLIFSGKSNSKCFLTVLNRNQYSQPAYSSITKHLV